MHSERRLPAFIVKALAVGVTVVGIAAATFVGVSSTQAAHFSSSSTSSFSNLWYDF
jgi:hypothetical protein